MAIKNFNFKFDFTAVNEEDRHHHVYDEIVIRLDATLIMPDTAGQYIDINYILEAFEKIGFSNPIFRYGKIEATKEIRFSEFCREWEILDPFGIQVIKDSDLGGYHLNFNTPRDVIPKKR